MRQRLLAGLTVAALLAVPAVVYPQDLTTLLAIFLRNLAAGQIVIPQETAFASLPSVQDGVIVYCSDCLEGSDPASGSSTGAFVLRVNGRWAALDGGSGGSGTPGGADTQVQFNDGGAFAGDSGMTFVKATNTLSVDAIVSTLTGNASSATALAANPGDCAANRYATTIAASGDLTCAQVDLANGVTGTLPIGNGGTGQTGQTAAFDALSPLTTRGDMLTHNGSDNIRLALGSIYQGPVSDGTDLSYRSISFIGGFVAPTFTTSSTSYVDVTGLTLALPANLIFAFDCYGTFTTSDNAAGTSNGLGISVNGTGGTSQAAQYSLWLQTTAMNTSGNNTTSTGPFGIRNENTFNSMTALASVISVSTSLVWQMKGFYYTGTSGNSTFAVRVRSENGSPQSASIQVGSYCLFTKQG